jgi:ABC-type multidrug transport system fused ATPase/permease subunit
VLLLILLLFEWTSLVGVVRAEFLRARNFEYVNAARALGLGDRTIMVKHVLPNAMVATLTLLPFVLNGSITTLTSLDFLGFGLPPGSPSLGELLQQGKSNLQAPWLGISGFFVIALMLSCSISSARRCVTPSIRERPSHERMLLWSPCAICRSAFRSGRAHSTAVDHVSFEIRRGETLALVGESGSGKSVSALSIVRLLNYPAASHPSGDIRFEGEDLLQADEARMRQIRGNKITMVFQEPMTSLNPLHTVERQISEILSVHRGPDRRSSTRAHAGAADPRRHSRSGNADDLLSASDVRRPAPAGGHRHGARQRARSADRR